MKKLIAGLMLALCAIGAQAQFISGQVLTAAQLNAQFALYLPLSGGTVSGGVTVNGPLTVNGLLTATGNIGLGSLAAQAANTVVANITGASASPSAAPVPSCSTSASALNYTSGTGFSCNTAVNAAQLGSATFAAPTAIGSTTANTGAFTTLSASSTVSGAGFTARFSTPGPIGNTAASTGAFTTLTTSSTFTPSSTAGIVGTAAGDNANSGSVGEFNIASTQNTSVSTGVTFNATSVSLPAGDWDVWGAVSTNPAGSTVTTGYQCGLSTTSATFGTFAPGVSNANGPVGVSGAAGVATNVSCPLTRINVSAPTTVYVVANITFTTSTMQASGAIMYRRRR